MIDSISVITEDMLITIVGTGGYFWKARFGHTWPIAQFSIIVLFVGTSFTLFILVCWMWLAKTWIASFSQKSKMFSFVIPVFWHASSNTNLTSNWLSSWYTTTHNISSSLKKTFRDVSVLKNVLLGKTPNDLIRVLMEWNLYDSKVSRKFHHLFLYTTLVDMQYFETSRHQILSCSHIKIENFLLLHNQ